MPLPVWLHTLLIVIVVVALLFLLVAFVVACLSLCKGKQLFYMSDLPKSKLYEVRNVTCLNAAFEEQFEDVDVSQVIERREERFKNTEELIKRGNIKIRPLQSVDNEIATALAVEQLIDTSFLISNEELVCYAPHFDIKVLASCRDNV